MCKIINFIFDNLLKFVEVCPHAAVSPGDNEKRETTDYTDYTDFFYVFC
jgi:hypothetical protein